MKSLLVATLVLVLAACGSKDEEEVAPASTAGSKPAAAGGDSVAAVLESQGAPVAQLRFVIETRPVVGKPFRVQLIAAAPAAVPSLRAAIESDRLVTDVADVALELGPEGDGANPMYRARHYLSVTAREAGLAELFVHLTAGADAAETLYAIPVLVARAEPAAVAPAPASDEPDPAAEADHGQP
jgi:hypothetical protein